jgi:MFS family permease
MSSHPPRAPAPSITLVLLALLGTHLAAMGAFLGVPVLAPLISSETGIPPEFAGINVALVYGGSLISGPLTGALIARLGPVRLCQAALALIALGLVIATLGHPAAFIASALVCGVGHGPLTPAGSHLLHDRAPQRSRSLIFSVKQTGVPGGAMLIGLIAPPLGLALGWRGGIAGLALLAVMTAVALQPLRASLDADRDPGHRVGLKGARASLGLFRSQPKLRAIALVGAAYGVSQFCFSSFFVVFQTEVLNYDLLLAGLNLSLSQAAGAAGRVLWGLVADMTGPIIVLSGLGIATALAAVTLALAAPDWPPVLVAAAGVAMGATAIGWNGVLLSETARLAPVGQVGAATGMLSFVFALAMMVAPPGFSGLVQLTGNYVAGFVACGICALIGVALLAPLRRAAAAGLRSPHGERGG